MIPGYHTTTNDRYRPAIYYMAILLVVLTIAYWPISFHVFSLKNDALNYFLPLRRLVSESYSAGTLPLWSPYINLGYPLHGDMQSGVWNPIVQFFSLFGTYSLYTLMLETLLYVFIGGVGMFFLLKHFGVHPLANMLAATAYMLCGFNTDSCQFLNWIAGTAFLPFTFLFYYRCLYEKSIVQGLYAGLSHFLLFACAYPADFIITSYLLLALLIVHLVQSWKRQGKIFTRELLLSHLMMISVFLLLAAPAILSYLQSLPLQERGNGASYADVMSNPLHPALLSSFTTPLGIWKMPGVSITDPLERNSYIGLGGFILMLTAFLSRFASPLVRISKWALLIFLLFSLGEMGGLRVLSYYMLPLMDTFRHPANAKMFTLFFACILAGFSFHSVLNGDIPSKTIRRVLLISTGIVSIILIHSWFTPLGIFSKIPGSTNWGNISSGAAIKSKLAQLSYADIVLINSIIQFGFLLLFYRYLIKKPNYRRFTVVALINSVLFAMLFQPFTVVKKASAKDIQDRINQVAVAGYPAPDVNATLYTLSEGNEEFFHEIGCLSPYSKKPGRSEYRITPNNLLLQNQFWFDTVLRSAIMHYPLLYKTDIMAPRHLLDEAVHDTVNRWTFVDNIREKTEVSNKTAAQITLSKFEPNHFEGVIETDENGFFVLMQNYYPRWTLTIDGVATPIKVVNTSFMGFEIPKGSHQFSFQYRSIDLKVALITSLVMLGGILIFATKRALKKL